MDDRLKRKEDDTARTISWKIMLEQAQESVKAKNFQQAEKLFERALQTAERRLGEDDILVAHILMEVADYHLNQANTAKAQQCYTRVRKILAEQVVGHPAYSS